MEGELKVPIAEDAGTHCGGSGQGRWWAVCEETVHTAVTGPESNVVSLETGWSVVCPGCCSWTRISGAFCVCGHLSCLLPLPLQECSVSLSFLISVPGSCTPVIAIACELLSTAWNCVPQPENWCSPERPRDIVGT